jgi:hypothetical protein
MPAPSSSTNTTMMMRAAHGRTSESDMSPPRCGAIRSEKCQARSSAISQAPIAIDSRRKPRAAPTMAEMMMAAITR